MAAAEKIRRVLMRKDVEVVEFTFDVRIRSVTGKHAVLSPQDLPVGCSTTQGFSSGRLGEWIERRAIPPTRQGIEPVLKRLNLMSPAELLDSGLALSLSDQYWLRDPGDPIAWEDVNFFENDFPTELGEALVPRAPSSRERLRAIDLALAASSPDAALSGNLPKRWEARGGKRVMVKSGKQSNLFAEPVNELAASRLCELILDPADFVPYWVEPYEWPEHVSVCPCMVDTSTELVSAYDLLRASPKQNAVSLYERYCRLLESHGINDVRRSIAKTLVVDHVIANFDRHWGNFGILMHSDSRTWLRAAPIFDNGESLFCDQFASNVFAPIHAISWMPFSRRVDEQAGRYVQDLDWLDEKNLRSFPAVLHTTLQLNSLVKAMPHRVDAIVDAVEKRIEDVLRTRDQIAHKHVTGRGTQMETSES